MRSAATNRSERGRCRSETETRVSLLATTGGFIENCAIDFRDYDVVGAVKIESGG